MRFENYSYLPPLTMREVQAQVDDLLISGCVPIIEYMENPSQFSTYWQMWHLPSHKEMTCAWVTSQIEVCARKNPFAYVRVQGYDKTKRTVTHSFVAKTPVD